MTLLPARLMNALSRLAAHFFAIALVTMVAVGCSNNPERATAEYVKSGDTYFAQKKYAEAAVQYRNALQQDPKSGDAHLKLAKTYEQLGALGNAGREFIRAADAMPGIIDAVATANSVVVKNVLAAIVRSPVVYSDAATIAPRSLKYTRASPPLGSANTFAKPARAAATARSPSLTAPSSAIPRPRPRLPSRPPP